MKKVFISRNLSSKSIFYIRLKKKVALFDVSLLVLRPLVFDASSTVDWLFFYSKNAIKFYFVQEGPFANLPSVAVIGNPSANFLKSQFNIQAKFVGDGYPETTAKRFKKLIGEQKVAFVQAVHSRKSVQQFARFNAEDRIVYDNYKKQDFELPPVDILAFTSPMNVQAYFQKYSYSPEQKYLAIGPTTAQALADCGVASIHIAKEPSENALAELCLSLLNE
jgi:uroporphyrinogen-III synthase